MPADPSSFLLAITIVILSGAVVGLVASYSPLLRWFYSFKTQEREANDNSIKEAEVILEDARKRALDIISQAGITAENNIKNLNITGNKVNEEIDFSLREMAVKTNDQMSSLSKQFTDEYKNFFENSKSDTLKNLANISATIDKELAQTIDSLHSTVTEETRKSIQVVQSRLTAASETVQIDIKEYKEHQMAVVDKQIADIVALVVKETTGKVISTNDHKDLIIKSLEKLAKFDHDNNS